MSFKKFSAAALVILLTGCATPLSYREKGFMTGAAIGGGTGYLIGTRTGHPRLTAAIGAGIGALTGALIGSAIDGSRQAAVSDPPSGPPMTQAPAPPVIQVPGSYGDPTAGTFVNGTPWQVSVRVDAGVSPWGGVAFTLGPGQAQPAYLDIGPHRVTAEASVGTQFGPRLVGRYDRMLDVDPRGSGWSLRFDTWAFR